MVQLVRFNFTKGLQEGQIDHRVVICGTVDRADERGSEGIDAPGPGSMAVALDRAKTCLKLCSD